MCKTGLCVCVCVCSLSPSHSRWPHTPLSLRWVSPDPARPKSRCPCSASPSTQRSLQHNREQEGEKAWATKRYSSAKMWVNKTWKRRPRERAVGAWSEISDGCLLCCNEEIHIWSVRRVILLMRGLDEVFCTCVMTGSCDVCTVGVTCGVWPCLCY